VTSRHLGQEDSPSRQIPFHFHLPNGQGMASHQLPTKSLKQEILAKGKQHLRHLSQGQAGNQVF